jgi:hypothetical protein
MLVLPAARRTCSSASPATVCAWLDMRPTHAGGELAGAMSFLMQLGFRQVGRPYPLEALGAQEQRIAAHMAQLGLLATYIAVSHGCDCVPAKQPCLQSKQ